MGGPAGCRYDTVLRLLSPVSRKALIEYYTEIFNALPEAEGLFIESADPRIERTGAREHLNRKKP